MMSSADCQPPACKRGALYVDGFNLYHPINDSGDHHLKWASMWKLGELLCNSHNLVMVKAVICTALPKHLPEKMGRHNTFVSCQIATGSNIIKGHYVPQDNTYAEKQTDINLALAVILDGIDDVYDSAFLLSADSDQVATAKAFKARLAPQGKQLIAAIPPGKTCPTDYRGLGVTSVNVSRNLLEQCVLPEHVNGKAGLITRPQEYAPPNGWVHPDDRPKGKVRKAPKKWGPTFRA
jgi:hypothetical protein